MAKDTLTGSPFEKPVCDTPSPSASTLAGQRGGADWPLDNDGARGLATSPFEKPIASAPGGKETPNRSELPLALTSVLDVKDGPAAGSQVSVAPGVASPAVAVTPIDRK